MTLPHTVSMSSSFVMACAMLTTGCDLPPTRPPDPATCPALDAAAAPVEHSETIVADEAWPAAVHLLTFGVSVRSDATLTIEPCAIIKVRHGYGIDVQVGGTLLAEGSPDLPIRFEPEDAEDTWGQIQILQGQSRLSGVTLVGGGDLAADPESAALWVRGDSGSHVPQPLVSVRDVTISGAAQVGLRVEANATFTEDSDRLTVTGSASNPVMAGAGSVGSLPAGDYTGNGIDEVLIMAGDIEWDMTMHDRGVPYHVGRLAGDSLRVMGAAIPLLTIEPGVTLRFEPAGSFEVEHFRGAAPATGALVAVGTEGAPITFTSGAVTPAAGDWIGISFGSVPDPRNRMEQVRVEFAGGPSGSENYSCENPAAPSGMSNFNNAGIGIFGVPASAFITSTTISDSAGDGIERGWLGEVVDFGAGNTFVDVAWCQQSFPRPEGAACPVPAPCVR
ncbi:MAG: hypothetical protein IT383_12275 [Deltaproteobacteria bacterium]|nr:hypothetical protein [Deltaproteobacteria bacterium]